MAAFRDAITVFLVITMFAMLGTSRISACVRLVAAQGFALGLAPLLFHAGPLGGRALGFSACVVAVKGLAIPWLLGRALRGLRARRVVEPIVGFTASLLVGVAGLAGCLRLGAGLPVPGHGASGAGSLLSVGFFLVLMGLFLIVSRRKAIVQAIGYLVLENGVFAAGLALAGGTSVGIEIALLLDVLVAVFVMGIAIFHIHRTFDHIDTDRLSALRD